jgi:hypothetical protein
MKKTFTTLFLLLVTCCVASAANYLTFTAESDNADFSRTFCGNLLTIPDIQYSLDDGQTWTSLGGEVLLKKKGDKALLRGNNPEGLSQSSSNYVCFQIYSPISVSGSVMSLIDGTGESDTIPNAYCFYRLFYNCAGMIQAPDLPATALTKGCYQNMFEGCTNLKRAPELPAMTLAEGCYQNMFYGCTNLTEAFELPSSSLAKNCYSKMF